MHNRIFNALIEKGAKNAVSKIDYNKIIDSTFGLHNIPLLSSVLEHFPVYLSDELNTKTFSMQAVIYHNIEALKMVYMGKEELLHYYYDRNGFNSLISLFSQLNSLQHNEIFLSILEDAKDIKIEPPVRENIEDEGVCHWCCKYGDLEAARLMLKTKGVLINKFNKSGQTGAFYLTNKKTIIQMLELLMENGFDVNARRDMNSQTLLEYYIFNQTTNYEAISFIIKYGADVNAKHSRNNMTLYQYVQSRGNSKLKKIFNEASQFC